MSGQEHDQLDRAVAPRDGSPHSRRRRLLVPRGIAGVWLLTGVVAAATAALYLLHVRHLHALQTSARAPWWAVAAGFAAAELFVVHLHFRRSAHSVSLSELPLVFGLVLGTPGGLLLGQLLGPGLVLALNRRLLGVRLAFNLAMFAFGACLAATVFHLILPVGDALGPDVWGATFAATVVAACAAVLLVGAAISLSEGAVGAGKLVHMLGIGMAVAVTNTSLGLAGTTIVATDARGFWLLAIPAVTLFVAYRAYLSQRQQHESLEFLYEATRTLSRSPDIEPALMGLLANTLDVFRAELAEVILFPSSANGAALRTTLGPGERQEVMGSMDPDTADELRSMVQLEGPAVLLERPCASPRVERYLEERGVERAMLAVLPGETRVVGTIMIANRLGVTGAFGADDLKLFEALANHASVSLEYDRLEHAVGQLRELQAQLEHQAFHDPLTNLANRRLFLERVEHALARRDSAVAVLFLDLDDFKTINDSLGHQVGDELLAGVARRLESCLRDGDTAARLGGDEFALLLEDFASEDDVIEIADRVGRSLSTPVTAGGRVVLVHASIGIATDTGSDEAQKLLRDADVAMYEAKRRGKRRHEVFEPQMAAAVLQRHQLKEELAQAVERSEFVVHYQPIVELGGEAVVGVEALVRWDHPRRGLVPPNDFIPLAEETGLIVPITRMVLRTACRQVSRWQAAHPGAPLSVHVNLSGKDLFEPGLLADVRETLRDSGLAPRRLVLEITESTFMLDMERGVGRLEALRALGVRLAMDDFGTGYSSLSALRQFPLDVLKIDRSFMRGVRTSDEDWAFIRTIVDLAAQLRLEVVVEGIETAEQLEGLHVLRAQLGQGWLFARPLDAAATDELLARVMTRRHAA